MSFKERSKDEQKSANDAQHRFSCNRSTTNASSRHAIVVVVVVVVVVRSRAHLESVVLEIDRSSFTRMHLRCVFIFTGGAQVLCGVFLLSPHNLEFLIVFDIFLSSFLSPLRSLQISYIKIHSFFLFHSFRFSFSMFDSRRRPPLLLQKFIVINKKGIKSPPTVLFIRQ